MGYWDDAYGGKKSKEFIEGVIAGVRAYAVWKNGNQFVGISERPLKTVIQEIKDELGWNPEWDR